MLKDYNTILGNSILNSDEYVRLNILIYYTYNY